MRGSYEQQRHSRSGSVAPPPRGWRSIAPKVRILKNLFVLGGACFCSYGASYYPLRTFVVISPDLKLLGPLSIALLCALGSGSALYGSIVARKLTYTVCLALAQLPFGLFVAAVAYNHYYTLIPAVILIGLFQGPLWNSAVAYIVNMSAQYAYFSYNSKETIVPYFLGSFNAFLALGSTVGHLLTAGAFNAIENERNTTVSKNSAADKLKERWSVGVSCGRGFCNSPHLLTLPSLEDHALSFSFPSVVPVYYVTVCAGLVIASVILALFPLGKLTVQLCSQTQAPSSAVQLFSETIQVFNQRRIQLLIPLFVTRALFEAFLYCDIAKAFIGCISEPSTIGYVLFAASAVSAFLHTFLSSVLNHIPRMTVLCVAGAVQIGSVAVLWMWKPVADDLPILYVIAGSWEMGNTIWKVLCQTLLFEYYPERWEAPLVALHMCTSLGLSLGFGLCPFGCFQTKLIFYSLPFALSTLPAVWLEYQLKKSVGEK